MTDLSYLRRRQAGAAAALDQVLGRPGSDPQRMLAQVVSVSYPSTFPTAVPAYFLTHPVTLGGATTEGGAGSLAVSSGFTYVYVLGPQVPSVGTLLAARNVGGRWAAQYGSSSGGGGGTVTPSGCPWASPVTLYMHVAHPDWNNHILQPCTLVYGPTPAQLLPVDIGQSAYLSTQQFQDLSTGDWFWYYLSCFLGYYILTRVYATSVYGSPYRDAVRYRWAAGNPGNTPSPFALTVGNIFSGGDQDSPTMVTITGTS